MRIYILLIFTLLIGCEPTIEIDFSKDVIACTNKYDSKENIIYYSENKSSFRSQSTGVIQHTFIDIYQNRRMINEYEMENYVCNKLQPPELEQK
jgi:hypothetical protein